MPDWLHEVNIKSFIIISEINPSTKSIDNLLPFGRVPHDNRSTLFIVLFDSHFKNLSFIGDAQSFINFVFNWKSMAIPTETTWDIMFSLSSVPADNILDGACADVAVMRSTGSEWRTIVESEGWVMLGYLKLFLEWVLFCPVLQNFLLLGWERDSLRC